MHNAFTTKFYVDRTDVLTGENRQSIDNRPFKENKQFVDTMMKSKKKISLFDIIHIPCRLYMKGLGRSQEGGNCCGLGDLHFSKFSGSHNGCTVLTTANTREMGFSVC